MQVAAAASPCVARSRVQRCRASAGDAPAAPQPLRRRAALASAAAALLAGVRVLPARAEGEEGAADGSSPLVAELLRRSAENKAANDKARRDYSKQYSGCVARCRAAFAAFAARRRVVAVRCHNRRG